MKALLILFIGLLPALTWGQGMPVAPDFSGTTLNGAPFGLRSVVGKKMIALHFFSTTCEPCREEFPLLEQFYRSYSNDNFELLGIDAMERPEKVRAFMGEMNATFPVMIDTGQLAQTYRVEGYPTTIVIGTDGFVQHAHLGVMDVNNTLGPLLHYNQQIVAQGKNVTEEEFVQRQQLLHLRAIELPAPFR